MTLSKFKVLSIEAHAKNYVSRFDKKKLASLSKIQILAVGYEDGMKSRAGMDWKPQKLTTKVFVKPKPQ